MRLYYNTKDSKLSSIFAIFYTVRIHLSIKPYFNKKAAQII